MKATFPLRVVTALLLAACAGSTPAATALPAQAPTALPASTALPQGLTLAQVRNAVYPLQAVGSGRTVTLQDGAYEGGEPGSPDYVSVRAWDYSAAGDLDGDGLPELVTLLGENYGGTGVFVFTAVFTQGSDGSPRFVAAAMLDDRPLVEALKIEGSEISLAATVHGPEDAMCCPAWPVTYRYRLLGAVLRLSEMTSQTPGGGSLRRITIDSPGDGAEVGSVFTLTGAVTIAPFENNLVYHLYDAQGSEIAVGPLNVNSPEPGAAGTFELALDLAAAGYHGPLLVALEDVSMMTGYPLALESRLLIVR